MIRLFIAAILCGIYWVAPLPAQALRTITQGKESYRPVVCNGRVVWFESREANRTIGRVSLYLFEKGQNRLITNDASVLFSGWPDLDAGGNIAYMKNMGTGHDLFLHDGEKENQITHNPSIRGSDVAVGLGSDKTPCGYPRIFNGDIVFRDAAGHLYLYKRQQNAIRKITTSAAQVVNLGDSEPELSIPLNAHIKYVEFDGEHIVWMHEDRGTGNVSTISLYMAKASRDYTPEKISSFEAWVPNNQTVIPGKVHNPFFRACGGHIVWQYYKPAPPSGVKLPPMMKDYTGADLNDTRVCFYDGHSVREIGSGAFVSYQSVRIQQGKALWIQTRKEGKGYDVKSFSELIIYEGGREKTIASYGEPPKHAKLKAAFWDGILDAEFAGDEVFWVMDQNVCFQHIRMPMQPQPYCAYQSGAKTGFFKRSFGTSYPFRVLGAEQFGGGGEFDRGLFVFFNKTLSNRDLLAMQVVGSDTAQTDGLLTLTDNLAVNRTKWKAGTHTYLIDAFSVAYSSLSPCGTASQEAVEMKRIRFNLDIQRPPSARDSDIVAITLHEDLNRDGRLDAADRLLSKKTMPQGTSFTMETGNGIPLTQGAEPTHFLVSLEMQGEAVCPCGEYKLTAEGSGIGLSTSAVVISAEGISTGALYYPPAELHQVHGDEQASLPQTELPQPLRISFDRFPTRCGELVFALHNARPGDDAVLIASDGRKGKELKIDWEEKNGIVAGEVRLLLGKREGLYNVEAFIRMPDSVLCENPSYIFREHAGKMTLHLLDANDPAFYTATIEPAYSGYSGWKATFSADPAALAQGGQGRVGACADGASMLLLRLQLLGFQEAPPGDISLSLSATGPAGHLSKGLGETIPNYQGGNALRVKWIKTPSGIFAFALYTPPLNFGNVSENDRNVHILASYTLPGTSQTTEKEEDLALFRPPVAFIHGLWSDKHTWGPAFIQQQAQFDTYLLDYADLNAISFSQLSFVVRDGIQDIVQSYRSRKVAATRVSIVGHSMGGLVTRQFFADNGGRSYFRPENFGQGDVYKFITIGTPHLGSPLSWLMSQMKSSPYVPIYDLANIAGADIVAGAVDAMCPGSPEMKALGATHIPSHTVRAWNMNAQAGDFFDPLEVLQDIKALGEALLEANPADLYKALGKNLIFLAVEQAAKISADVGLSSLYAADRTDMLVTLESQGGGIAQGQNQVFDKTIHFATPLDLSPALNCETTNPAIAAYVFRVLNQDIDNIEWFAPKLPPPSLQDSGKHCE